MGAAPSPELPDFSGAPSLRSNSAASGNDFLARLEGATAECAAVGPPTAPPTLAAPPPPSLSVDEMDAAAVIEATLGAEKAQRFREVASEEYRGAGACYAAQSWAVIQPQYESCCS